MGPKRLQYAIPRGALIVLLGGVLATAVPEIARADQEQIAQVTQRVADLEVQSAQASQRAHEAYTLVQQSRARLSELSDQVDQAQIAFAESKTTLDLMAREVYVSGGVEPRTLALVVGDAESFLRSLDDLVSAGNAQNSAVAAAETAAAQLVALEEQVRQENAQFEQNLDRLGQEKAAAQEALSEAQRYLQELQEQERLRVAAAIAAAREAERQRAEAAAKEAERQRAEAAAREAQRQQAEAAAREAQRRVSAAPAPAAAPYANTGASDPGFAAAAAWAASPAAQAVIFCESSGNYSINTGNGYYGAWQFDYPSWHWNGGGRFAEYPHQATKAQQDFVAWTYYQRSGWRPWECALKVL